MTGCAVFNCSSKMIIVMKAAVNGSWMIVGGKMLPPTASAVIAASDIKETTVQPSNDPFLIEP